MAASSMVHIRIDDELKETASANLEKMGLTVSDAVRMMLMRVAVEKALPFDVRIPNPATAKAMEQANRKRGKRFHSAKDLFEDLGI